MDSHFYGNESISLGTCSLHWPFDLSMEPTLYQVQVTQSKELPCLILLSIVNLQEPSVLHTVQTGLIDGTLGGIKPSASYTHSVNQNSNLSLHSWNTLLLEVCCGGKDGPRFSLTN